MTNLDRSKIDAMCLEPSHTIRQAMEIIGKGGIGTAFIVEPKSRTFIGLLTDGDIRRALLKGQNLETPLSEVAHPSSKVATTQMTPQEIAGMFGDMIRVIPVLDDQKKIADIALYDQRFRLPVAEPSLGDNELKYVTDCIVSNWISSTGKYVGQFESMFAQFCNAQFAVSTSNGTTALHLALLAAGVGPGDEVIVPSLTFIATANAVTYTGAKPIFVDSEDLTWNIDPKAIEAAVTPKTKAIIPVHLYGHPADMDPIMAIARKHKLLVIEDAAEAHGAEYKGQKVGAIGDCGVFSFYGNKIITTGEGGMIVTNNAALAQNMRLLRDHGMSPTRRYWHPVVGYNYRLTNIQAAIGVAQLERIDTILNAKLDIARRYHDQLKSMEGLILAPQASWAKNVYWLYSILVTPKFGMSRDELMAQLNAKDIDTRPFFPCVHQQPIYNTGQNLSKAQALSNSGLSLPSSAGLRMHEVDRVCQAISSIYTQLKKTSYAS